ncbi:MAG: endonuclease V [Candidatus Thermoplasmatota archaeon]|nr:endonuclease V [Candidatus Thermoplasmatota archaeon]
MGSIIKLGGISSFEDLVSVSGDLPVQERLPDHFRENIFPLLNMGEWISILLEALPEGSFTTFGRIASALGTVKASRAVGELISKGKVSGPVHRVVYSDGTVPSRSPLLAEFEHGTRIPLDDLIDFEVLHPPLYTLISVQESLRKYGGGERFEIETIAGMDISSGADSHVGAIVVMERNGELLGETTAVGELPLPYISGLLFFREAPILVPLMEKAVSEGMVNMKTLFVLDGNGILHPRRMGLASQVGIVTKRMTCGIAKKINMGVVKDPVPMDHLRSKAPVMDGKERIGTALVKRGSKPVYLSRGHGCEDDYILDVLTELWKYRIPEPTRKAHELANRVRRELPSG